MENTPYLFDQLQRKRSRTNSSSMDDDMEEDEEGNFHANNRSPGSQGSAGWEVEQGIEVLIFVLICLVIRIIPFC